VIRVSAERRKWLRTVAMRDGCSSTGGAESPTGSGNGVEVNRPMI
jgi:hypothetical protein